MEVPVLSKEWVSDFVECANQGPSEERVAQADVNYWQWIARKQEDLNVSLALVVVDELEQVLRGTILHLEQGRIAEASLATATEVSAADLVLGGTEADWMELMHGPRSLSQNIMYRKLRLYRGDLHVFFRNIYCFVEMIRAGLRGATAE